MPNDPLANMIERLPARLGSRKIGNDVWESKCPGHGSRDHAACVKTHG